MPQPTRLTQIWRRRGDATAEVRRDPSQQFFRRLRVARVAAIAVAAVAFCGYLDHFTQAFDYLEQKTYGERLEVSARWNVPLAQRAQQRIALVTLSDASYEWANRGRPPSAVFPRTYHAQAIRQLTRLGAKVIAFDVWFDPPQAEDAKLAAAVRSSGRVLLACDDKGADLPEIAPPEPLLMNAGARQGHTRVPVDSERPAIDRIAAVVADRGRSVPAFSVEAARMALGLTDQPVRRTAGGWHVGSLSVPVDDDGTFKIRYLGSSGETFTPIPYESLINGTFGDEAFRQDFFKDKIVVIGDTTRIHGDVHMTPLGAMPGVEIQAYAIATLLEGRFLRAAPPGAEITLLVVLAALAALLASVWRLHRAALFLVLLLPAYFFFNVWMFVERDIFLHLVAPSLAFTLTALGVLLERGLAEEQEKTRMRGLLRRYVSPQIAGYILQHPELLGHSGKRVIGTVLFSDIRDFTSLSEHLPPEELVSRMNEYFQAMTDIVFRHDGTAASIRGDGMLALFGVPVPYPDHARRAVASAIEMQSALTGLQEQWRSRGQKAFDIGIGINTGEMVVGDVGGQRLTNFTVYGLQVNIAARVEGLNKELGSRILVTRATYSHMAEEVEARGPLLMPIKGIEDSVEVFEILGWRAVPAANTEAVTSPEAQQMRADQSM